MDLHERMFGLAGHARAYHRITGPFFGRMYARIAADVAAAGLPEGARVLDAGTGPGRVPLALARAVPGLRIDGVDLSPEMVAEARRAAAAAGATRVTFTVADVAALPFMDDTFDLIVSSMSLHHWADPAAGVRELRRVLRPGGRMWIYDARVALRRGEVPGVPSRREAVRTGRLPIRLVGRLVYQGVPSGRGSMR
ncbi:class I SAM-dependent methyltransferase [Dactylosporangium sp. McL0621]|uniref:class I SAM-dependent methyltransferase n=1 Tax=Dactylosporangium sp. McL0621 TaxID=3415678 RepID=UPI003CE9E05B